MPGKNFVAQADLADGFGQVHQRNLRCVTAAVNLDNRVRPRINAQDAAKRDANSFHQCEKAN